MAKDKKSKVKKLKVTTKKPAKKAKAKKSLKAAKTLAAPKSKGKSAVSGRKVVAPKKTAGKSTARSKIVAKNTPAKKTQKNTTIKELPKLAKPIRWENALAPLANRVVISPVGQAERTAGGIIIPGTATLERPLKGQVLAVGKGSHDKKGRLKPLDVKIGDEVVYAKYSGTEVTVEGMEVLILKEDDILGIVS